MKIELDHNTTFSIFLEYLYKEYESLRLWYLTDAHMFAEEEYEDDPWLVDSLHENLERFIEVRQAIHRLAMYYETKPEAERRLSKADKAAQETHDRNVYKKMIADKMGVKK